MTSRFSISSALLVLCAVAAVEAAPPPSVNHLVDQTRFSQQDRDQVRRYTDYWCDQLATASPEKLRDVRRKLLEPLRDLRVRPLFRDEYSRAALPQLEGIIDGDNPHPAYCAIQAVAYLGTDRALDALVSHCDPETEQRLSIRLSAAKNFIPLVQRGDLAEAAVTRAVRQLGQAAGRETNWLALLRQFEAIASVDDPVSRDVQVEELRVTTQRMARKDNGPSPMMKALHRALVQVRNEYLNLKAFEQERFGQSLGPVLCNVCTVAKAHWDRAQDDSAAKNTYGAAIQLSEGLLKLIDPDGRPGQRSPKTALGPAWQNRDVPRFDADHILWRNILNRPPFLR